MHLHPQPVCFIYAVDKWNMGLLWHTQKWLHTIRQCLHTENHTECHTYSHCVRTHAHLQTCTYTCTHM
jgi:hypothetical protein